MTSLPSALTQTGKSLTSPKRELEIIKNKQGNSTQL